MTSLRSSLDRIREAIRSHWRIALLPAVAGLTALFLPLGLVHLSYDVPFSFRPLLPITNIVIVYLDEESLAVLGRTEHNTLDRSVHARLLDILRVDGATMVLFDLIFATSNSLPEGDVAFARAMRNHGNVLLAAAYHEDFEGNNVIGRMHAPLPLLRNAAKAWGHAEFSVDADRVVRRIPRAQPGASYMVDLAARLLSPASPRRSDDSSGLWFNYYGPPSQQVFNAYSIQNVLDNPGVPAGVFSGKIVLVGERSYIGSVGQVKVDRFATPHTRFSGIEASGVELHATALANLLRGEALSRLPVSGEGFLIALWGCLLGFGLMCVRRSTAAVLAVLCCFLGSILSLSVLASYHVWYPWLIVAFAQPAIAAAGAWIVDPWRIAEPIAFISYRHIDGEAYAGRIVHALRERGYNVHLDVNSLASGEFPAQLKQLIRSVPNFIFIRSPLALEEVRISDENDWIRLELANAIESGRNIIPVHLDRNIPGAKDLPADISKMALCQGVIYSHEHFNSTIDQLVKLLVHKESKMAQPAVAAPATVE